jgi:hypothetical protein
MSDLSTIKLLDMYLEEASVPLFLSGFFRSPAQNFHTTEEVEMDIDRDLEDVAIVITSLTHGPRENEGSIYTNKRFKPPIFDEMGGINSFDMIQRQAGQSPFANPDYAANATRAAFSIFRKLENKIRRAVEQMAAQVLQTGKLTLTNAASVPLYAIDFQPKATHFPFASAVWAANGSTGVPLTDLSALATALRRDGKRNPNRLVFGESAFQRFLTNTTVHAALETRRIDIGSVAPETRGQGATFQGFIWIGNYRFEMWTYDGYYRDPTTLAYVPYVNTNKVLMMSEGARLDLTFGAIPMIVPPEQRALPFLPPRISADSGIDLTTNAWVTDDGKRVMVSAGTRPLTIPTAIDTFGAITVNATS